MLDSLLYYFGVVDEKGVCRIRPRLEYVGNARLSRMSRRLLAMLGKSMSHAYGFQNEIAVLLAWLLIFV